MSPARPKLPVKKTACRTPNADGVSNIPSWKYDAVRAAICAAMDAHEDGISFKDLRVLAKEQMDEDALVRLGSWGWHFTTVKLEMEFAGEISRAAGVSPQMLMRAQP